MYEITLQGFLDFGRSRGEGSYEYIDHDDCAFAQYLKSLGYTDILVGGRDFRVEGKVFYFKDFHPLLDEAIPGDQYFHREVHRSKRHTWPMLVERLESLMVSCD